MKVDPFVNKLKYWFILIAMFHSIYSIKYSFFYSSSWAIVLVLLMLDYKSVVRDLKCLNKPFFLYFVVISSAIFISALTSFYSDGDWYEAKNMLSGLLLTFLGICVVKDFTYDSGVDCFEKFLIQIVFIQAILSLFYLLSGSFASIVNTILPGGEMLEFSLEKVKGFTNTGAFGLNILQLFGFMLCYKYFLEAKSYIVLYLFSAIVIFLSILVTGRVGIFLSIVFVFLSAAFKPSIRLVWLLFTVFMLLLMFLYYVNYIDNTLLPKFNYMYTYAFEIVFKGGQSNSTNELKNMYIWPSLSLRSWFIGDGFLYNQFGGSEYGFYKNIDVGYYRNLYATGLLGCALIYSSVIYLYIYIIRIVTVMWDKFFITYLTVCMFILEAKGQVIPFGIVGYFLCYVLIMFNYYYRFSRCKE